VIDAGSKAKRMILLTANHNESFYHSNVLRSVRTERYAVEGMGVRNILRGLDRESAA